MGNLDWTKLIEALAWPVFASFALLLFYRPLAAVLDQFSRSQWRKAKFGPVELELEIDGLSKKLEEQRAEQEKQRTELETLRFLISYFLTEPEFKHIETLANDQPFLYEKSPFFESELRRLRALGMIRNFEGQGIRTLPPQGNLRDYFEITERGHDYLRLRQQLADQKLAKLS